MGKAGKKEEKKAAAMKRWEEGKLRQEEGKTYSAPARPIWDLASGAKAIEEVAAGQRIAHMAGMWVLGSQWEKVWARGHMASPQQQCQQQQCQQQQQPRLPGWQQQQRSQHQQRQHQQKQASLRALLQGQQQGNCTQRAAAAAALPQVDFKRVSRSEKPEWEPTGLEPIKGSIPRDERGIVFERAAGAPQIVGGGFRTQWMPHWCAV